MTLTETFLRDEQGAVNVDWVVLTAGLVGLGLALMSVVRDGTGDVATDISSTLAAVEINTPLVLPGG